MCCCRRIITRARKVVRLVGVTYYLLGHGVKAAHETLTLTVLVRTQVPQPIKTHRRRELRAESSRWVASSDVLSRISAAVSTLGS